MATTEQIESMLRKIRQATPTDFFKCVDGTQLGMTAVLRLLNESEGTVTAGKISDALHVSTARVAVLLKKMVGKGLISKETSAADARITIVHLTEHGQQLANALKEDVYRQMGRVIDEIGEERLNEYISVSMEIRALYSPPDIKF